MKKIILALLLLASPLHAEELTATIMFEVTGSEEDINEIAEVFLKDLSTEIIIQFKGYDFVAYCETMEKCTIVPGSIEVVAPEPGHEDI